jgi:hypothetical protein
MNRHSPHRSAAGMLPVFLFALAIYVLSSVALALSVGVAGATSDGPLHPTPGLGL